MANIVLYRKYRPQRFADVVGQEYVVRTLKNAVAGNLFSHAYLFSGPRGSGKTSIARLLAKAINCENHKEGEPCNKCGSCQEINSGRAIDLIEIDAASNRGIDDIRDLKEGIRFAPTRLRYKVFIIDEAHQLTKEAANALLKTLEEPPAHAVFILATTETHKMIPTILSRCQHFDFRKLTVAEIVKQLQATAKKEEGSIDKSALELMAANAGGSLRDALGLLDKMLTYQIGADKKEEITAETVRQLLGLVDTTIVAQFADYLAEKTAERAIEFLHEKLEQGMEPYEFAKNVVEYLRNVLVLKINPALERTLNSYTKEETNHMAQLAEKIDRDYIVKLVTAFMEAEQKMKYASIVQLPLELAIIENLMI